MRLPAALCLLTALAPGCLVEEGASTGGAAPPEAAAPGAAEGARPDPARPDPARPAPDPPVAAGDTARVTERRAGRAARVASGAAEADVSPSGWTVPVVGIAPGELVDTFEAARSEGRTHNAIDILAPRGTPVVAAAAGRVERLFTSDRGGLTVYVLGDGTRAARGRRLVHYYAHLDAYAPGLAEGQSVAAGDPIGTVGDTGNAAPGNTHLHFAVWSIAEGASFWDGDPVNPYGLLAR